MMIILKNPLSLSLSLVSRFIFSPPYNPYPYKPYLGIFASCLDFNF